MRDNNSLEGLRNKLYTRYFILLTLLILLVWLILFLPFYYEHKERKERELDYLLHSKKFQIERYFERLKITTEMISNANTPANGEISIDTKLLHTLKTANTVESIIITDKDGSVLGFAGKRIDKDFFASPYLNSIKTAHFTLFSIEGNPVIITVSPTLDDKSDIKGFTIVAYRGDELRRIITDYTGFGINGESIIGHIKGEYFYPVYKTREDERANEIRDIKTDWKSIIKNRDELNFKLEGKHFLLKAASIEDTDLALLISVYESEFYSYADNQYARQLIVAILIAVFGIYAIKIITNNLFHRLKVETENSKIIREELEAYKEHLEVRIEEEIKTRELKERLLVEQSKMATMGEMIGFITHQWKQPLTILSLMISNLQDKLDEDAETKEMLDGASQQITYLSQTITDFRDFLSPSKERSVFGLQKAMLDIERLVLPKAKGLNVNIKIECEKNILIQGYQNEFKHAVLNIINNAIDAIDSYRTKSALKKYEFEGMIEIKSQTIDDILEVEIADNGGGIPQESLVKIFDSYYTTKGEKGTGIGLYMAKMIIKEYMSGTLEAYNNENGGATFRITLRVARADI